MKSLLSFFVALAGVVSAQSISGPSANLVLTQDVRLVCVRSSFANLLPPVAVSVPLEAGEQIVSIAANSVLTAIKTEHHLVIADFNGNIEGSYPAPEGPALVAFGPVLPRIAWFGAQKQLIDLQTGSVVSTSSFGDDVLALGTAANGQVNLVVSTAGNLWALIVDMETGTISRQTPLPGSAPAARFENGWLTTNGTTLTWTSGSGESRTIELPETPVSLQRAGNRSLAINGKWLLTPAWQALAIPNRPSGAALRSSAPWRRR